MNQSIAAQVSLGSTAAFGLGAKDIASMQKLLGTVVPKIDFASLGSTAAIGLGAKDIASMQKLLGTVVPKIDFASLGSTAAIGLGAKDIASMQKLLGTAVPKINFASLGSTAAIGLGAKDNASMQKMLGTVVPKIDFASLNAMLSGASSSPTQTTDNADHTFDPDMIDLEAQSVLPSDAVTSSTDVSLALELIVAFTIYVAILAQHCIVGVVQLLVALTEFMVSAYGNADLHNPTVHGADLLVVLSLAIYAASKGRGDKR